MRLLPEQLRKQPRLESVSQYCDRSAAQIHRTRQLVAAERSEGRATDQGFFFAALAMSPPV